MGRVTSTFQCILGLPVEPNDSELAARWKRLMMGILVSGAAACFAYLSAMLVMSRWGQAIGVAIALVSFTTGALTFAAHPHQAVVTHWLGVTFLVCPPLAQIGGAGYRGSSFASMYQVLSPSTALFASGDPKLALHYLALVLGTQVSLAVSDPWLETLTGRNQLITPPPRWWLQVSDAFSLLVLTFLWMGIVYYMHTQIVVGLAQMEEAQRRSEVVADRVLRLDVDSCDDDAGETDLENAILGILASVRRWKPYVPTALLWADSSSSAGESNDVDEPRALSSRLGKSNEQLLRMDSITSSVHRGSGTFTPTRVGGTPRSVVYTPTRRNRLGLFASSSSSLGVPSTMTHRLVVLLHVKIMNFPFGAQPGPVYEVVARKFIQIVDEAVQGHKRGAIHHAGGNSVTCVWVDGGGKTKAAEAATRISEQCAKELQSYRVMCGIVCAPAMCGPCGSAKFRAYMVLSAATEMVVHVTALNPLLGTSILITSNVREEVRYGYGTLLVDVVSGCGFDSEELFELGSPREEDAQEWLYIVENTKRDADYDEGARSFFTGEFALAQKALTKSRAKGDSRVTAQIDRLSQAMMQLKAGVPYTRQLLQHPWSGYVPVPPAAAAGERPTSW